MKSLDYHVHVIYTIIVETPVIADMRYLLERLLDKNFYPRIKSQIFLSDVRKNVTDNLTMKWFKHL